MCKGGEGRDRQGKGVRLVEAGAGELREGTSCICGVGRVKKEWREGTKWREGEREQSGWREGTKWMEGGNKVEGKIEVA